MSKNFHWIASPPSMVLAALGLVFLSPVSNSPGRSSQPSACAAGGGRIAVAALDASPETEISAIAGRAPYYLLFESNELLQVITNEHANEDRSAGKRAAYRLSDLNVDCLVAGEAGSRMRAVLAAEGITFFAAEGDATAAISSLLDPAGSEGI